MFVKSLDIFLLHVQRRRTQGVDHKLKSSGGKLKAEGQVFTNLILDTCYLKNKFVHVLFDSGATHSFISLQCLEKFGLPVVDFGCELVVSTPTSRQV